MPTLPGLVLQLIEASWQLSLAFLPLLYLGFLGDAVGHEDTGSFWETIIWGQRSYTLGYGVYTVAGLLLGALPLLALEGNTGLLAGGLVAGAATVYGYMKTDLSGPRELDLGIWNDRLRLPWLLVPLLSVAALATGDLLLKSLVALVFLSAVFWEV